MLAGWALYLAVEWDASLAGLAPVDKVMNALFQSVTLRTAGINSVDYGQLEMATVFAMLGFMYIGASPGSTGGGVKTTTAVVLLATVGLLIGATGELSAIGKFVIIFVMFVGRIGPLTLALYGLRLEQMSVAIVAMGAHSVEYRRPDRHRQRRARRGRGARARPAQRIPRLGARHSLRRHRRRQPTGGSRAGVGRYHGHHRPPRGRQSYRSACLICCAGLIGCLGGLA